MYQLFRNKNDVEKNIIDVNYEDVQNLIKNEVHEGFYLDYKKEYNVVCKDKPTRTKAKKDLCDDICSFANNEGGWIIFGVEETEDHEFIDHPISKSEKLDYNQQVSEILKNGNVTPYPNFETKFVTTKEDKNKGYLLIHVFEGLFPPYISHGIIKTRIGSSSNPVDISDRRSLDAIYEKRKSLIEKNNDFCKREVYYCPTYKDRFQVRFELPMINIYLKNFQNRELYCFQEIENIAKDFCKNNIFSAYYYTSNSIVFFNSDIDTSTTNTLSAELFFDFSLKIHLPFILYDEETVKKIISHFPEKYSNFNFTKYKFINTFEVIGIICVIFKRFNEIITKNNVSLTNSIFSVELENSENGILAEESENYFKFIRERGLKRCVKHAMLISQPLSLYLDKDKTINMAGVINEFIIMPFGIINNEINEYNLFQNEQNN